MLQLFFWRFGKVRVILEWNSPKHIERFGKWVLCVFHFGLSNCHVWNVQILGLRLVVHYGHPPNLSPSDQLELIQAWLKYEPVIPSRSE